MATDVSWRMGRSGTHRALSKSAVAGIVAVLDACIIFFLGLGIFFLYLDDRAPISMYLAAIMITTYLVVHGLHTAGLYQFDRIIHSKQQLGSIVMTCAFTFLVLLAVAYGLKVSEEFSRVWALSWLLLMIVGLKLERLAVAAVIPGLARRAGWTRKIAIYGSGPQAKHFVERLNELNEPWNKIIGVFDDRKTRLDDHKSDLPISGDLDDLLNATRAHRADEVVVALPWIDGSDRIEHVLRKLSVLPANVRLCIGPSLARFINRRINNQYGVPVASIFERPITGHRALVKRAFDLTVGVSVLLLTMPLILLIALAIKLDSRGPVFFKQQRFGFNDELILIWKFRTMYQDQTDLAAERLATANDPRVTRVGYYLRRLSLDELPQLFNVVLGNMSLVGPRPHATRAKAGGRLYQEVVEHYSSRHRVKPGLTGWAQVNGWRGETDTDDKIISRVEHDLYYISNWSLWLDVKVLFMTFKVVFARENAY